MFKSLKQQVGLAALSQSHDRRLDWHGLPMWHPHTWSHKGNGTFIFAQMENGFTVFMWKCFSWRAIRRPKKCQWSGVVNYCCVSMDALTSHSGAGACSRGLRVSHGSHHTVTAASWAISAVWLSVPGHTLLHVCLSWGDPVRIKISLGKKKVFAGGCEASAPALWELFPTRSLVGLQRFPMKGLHPALGNRLLIPGGYLTLG